VAALSSATAEAEKKADDAANPAKATSNVKLFPCIGRRRDEDIAFCGAISGELKVGSREMHLGQRALRALLGAALAGREQRICDAEYL